MADCRANVRLTGKVQGVWFRQSIKEMAEQYDVTGWCQNNSDGSVEALFEGKKSSVQAVVDWCKHGPELARVDHMKLDWSTATGEFNGFSVRR